MLRLIRKALHLRDLQCWKFPLTFGMKGVRVYSGLPLEMLTFTRPILLNDPRVADVKLLRRVDCFFIVVYQCCFK